MTRIINPIFLFFIVLAAGCGPLESGTQPSALDEERVPQATSEHSHDDSDHDHTNGVDEIADQNVDEEPIDDGFPSSLNCISGVDVSEADLQPTVLRVNLTGEGSNGRQLIVKSGAMFQMHADLSSDEVQITSQGVSASIDDDGLLHVLFRAEEGVTSTRGPTFSATLSKKGPFFFGTLTEDLCTFSQERALTCWDPLEVFGSSWGSPPAFPAHFNWSEGRCTDADGNDALNEIPIEFLRETGFGVCANLRGVHLNGEDHSNPQLSWWNLQGANLEGARLISANISGATLNGAKMKDLVFNNATIQGSFDQFTELPNGECSVTDSSWGGSTVACSRQ